MNSRGGFARRPGAASWCWSRSLAGDRRMTRSARGCRLRRTPDQARRSGCVEPGAEPHALRLPRSGHGDTASVAVTAPTKARAWPCIQSMEGGIEYHVRPIRPDDAERERAFIVNLSPESRFQRLMYTLREPSAEFVARLVTVDQHRDMALVATLGVGREEKIIGVTRYSVDDNGLDCEFAVAVADDWQCRGIGIDARQDAVRICGSAGIPAPSTAGFSLTTSACWNSRNGWVSRWSRRCPVRRPRRALPDQPEA